MAHTNADNAFMAGSENDALYFGPHGTDLSSVTGLSSPVPTDLVDVGWLTDDGIVVGMSDSVDKIRGHQGNGIIRTYMSDSSTKLTASLVEHKKFTVEAYLGATITKIKDGEKDIAKIVAPASRTVLRLCMVADLFDVTTGRHRRYVAETVELGERSDQTYKVGDLTIMPFPVEAIEHIDIYSDEPALIV